MQFPSPLPPSQSISDYYKHNTIATMKTAKVWSAGELKLIMWGGLICVRNLFISVQSLHTKNRKIISEPEELGWE
jgi:hypothetical protein